MADFQYNFKSYHQFDNKPSYEVRRGIKVATAIRYSILAAQIGSMLLSFLPIPGMQFAPFILAGMETALDGYLLNEGDMNLTQFFSNQLLNWGTLTLPAISKKLKYNFGTQAIVLNNGQGGAVVNKGSWFWNDANKLLKSGELSGSKLSQRALDALKNSKHKIDYTKGFTDRAKLISALKSKETSQAFSYIYNSPYQNQLLKFFDSPYQKLMNRDFSIVNDIVNKMVKKKMRNEELLVYINQKYLELSSQAQDSISKWFPGISKSWVRNRQSKLNEWAIRWKVKFGASAAETLQYTTPFFKLGEPAKVKFFNRMVDVRDIDYVFLKNWSSENRIFRNWANKYWRQTPEIYWKKFVKKIYTNKEKTQWYEKFRFSKSKKMVEFTKQKLKKVEAYREQYKQWSNSYKRAMSKKLFGINDERSLNTFIKNTPVMMEGLFPSGNILENLVKEGQTFSQNIYVQYNKSPFLEKLKNLSQWKVKEIQEKQRGWYGFWRWMGSRKQTKIEDGKVKNFLSSGYQLTQMFQRLDPTNLARDIVKLPYYWITKSARDYAFTLQQANTMKWRYDLARKEYGARVSKKTGKLLKPTRQEVFNALAIYDLVSSHNKNGKFWDGEFILGYQYLDEINKDTSRIKVFFNYINTHAKTPGSLNYFGKKPVIISIDNNKLEAWDNSTSRGQFYLKGNGEFTPIARTPGGMERAKNNALNFLETLEDVLGFIPLQGMRNLLSITSNIKTASLRIAKGEYIKSFFEKLVPGIMRNAITRTGKAVGLFTGLKLPTFYRKRLEVFGVNLSKLFFKSGINGVEVGFFREKMVKSFINIGYSSVNASALTMAPPRNLRKYRPITKNWYHKRRLANVRRFGAIVGRWK